MAALLEDAPRQVEQAASRPVSKMRSGDLVLRDLLTSMIHARIERGLITPLSAWCERNAHLLRLVAIHVLLDGQISIYVSRRSAEFSFELSQEISRLELDELEHTLSVDVIQVPPLDSSEDVERFLRSYRAVVFYGEPGDSPAASEPPQGVLDVPAESLGVC